MRRVIVAGALALAVALPAGWATAKTSVPKVTSPKAPATHPHASAGRVNKSVRAGKTSTSVKARRTRAGTRPNKVKKTGRARSPAAGGLLGLSNPSVGGVTIGTRQRSNGHNGVGVRGNAKGTPAKTRLGL
jgi:hypothetical protein